MKINDIKILRNIIGDKVDPNEQGLPKYIPKRLNMNLNPAFKLGRDKYSRNAESVEDYREVLPDELEQPVAYPSRTETKEEKISPEQEQINREKEILKIQQDKFKLIEGRQKLDEDVFKVAKGRQELQENRTKYEREQIAERKKKLEEVGLIKLQQSKYGQFISGPWASEAGRLSKNIGQKIGFEDKTQATNLRNTILAKEAYIDLVKKRYKNRDPPITINDERDIMTIGSKGEKLKLVQLNEYIRLAQSGVARSGFLGNKGGNYIAQRISQQTRTGQNIPKLTQIGPSNIQLSAFGPESLGRLGVAQGLRAMSSDAKLQTFLSRKGTQQITPITLTQQPTDRINMFTKGINKDKFRNFL